MTRILFIFLPLLVSFSFTPMSQTIEVSEKQKQAQFLLDNPTGEPMAVEISVRERRQKPDGTEDTPVASDFNVFPPQLIIPPKEKRTVRVLWSGTIPKIERAYRVIAEQLPLQVDGKKKKGSGIKMMLKYVAALYLDPGDTNSDIRIVSITQDETLNITVENKGTKHQLLNAPIMYLQKGEQKIELKGDDLKGLAGENVLAGSTRVFKLKKQPKLTGEFKGSIKVE